MNNSKQSLEHFRNINITKIDIDGIIFLISHLTKALNKEIEILNKMDFNHFSTIYKDKIEMMEELEIHQHILEKKPELLKDENQSKIETLKKLCIPFEEAQKNNKRRLERAISMNQHVVNLVKQLVTEKIQSKAGYSKNGTYAVDSRMEEEMPAFNLNSVI